MNEKAYEIIFMELGRFEEEKSHSDKQTTTREEIIFSKWALEEILQFIWDRPWTPASETVLYFSSIMLECAGNAGTDEQKKIFQIAAMTALKLFEIMEGVKEENADEPE